MDITSSSGDSSSAMMCGPDGHDVDAAATHLPVTASVGTRIDIVSDAICPWCYVGKRQLERALALLAKEGLAFQVHWNPFQLNPDMPKEGRDRAAYRAWKFGSAAKATALPAARIEIELLMMVAPGLVDGVTAVTTPNGANSTSVRPLSPV